MWQFVGSYNSKWGLRFRSHEGRERPIFGILHLLKMPQAHSAIHAPLFPPYRLCFICMEPICKTNFSSLDHFFASYLCVWGCVWDSMRRGVGLRQSHGAKVLISFFTLVCLLVKILNKGWKKSNFRSVRVWIQEGWASTAVSWVPHHVGFDRFGSIQLNYNSGSKSWTSRMGFLPFIQYTSIVKLYLFL